LFWLGALVGFVAGTFVTAMFLAVGQAAKRADEDEDEAYREWSRGRDEKAD
jgi:hypothetical protein